MFTVATNLHVIIAPAFYAFLVRCHIVAGTTDELHDVVLSHCKKIYTMLDKQIRNFL